MFIYLSMVHLYYELIEDNSVSLRSLAMFGFTKQICVALSYKDGAPENRKKLTEREKSVMSIERPNFITLMAYLYFPG